MSESSIRFPTAVLDAIAFSARAHRNQVRKDGQTPYHSHVFRVCLIVRHVFGIDDDDVLTAAVLHDTIEDTTTDFDDVELSFGPTVAGWVAALSKDKRLPEDEREESYMTGLARAPWQVRICKMADIVDNLIDSAHLKAEQRKHTCRRLRGYLGVLDSSDLPASARQAWAWTAALLAQTEGTLHDEQG
jgi:guanosine-3',5'-bis(diphosphate) 3'-pyrophosphohydrolase